MFQPHLLYLWVSVHTRDGFKYNNLNFPFFQILVCLLFQSQFVINTETNVTNTRSDIHNTQHTDT